MWAMNIFNIFEYHILHSAFGMTGIFGLNMGTTVSAIYANI